MRNGKTYRRVVDSTPAAFLHRKYYVTAQVFSYRVETIWPCIAFVSWCKGEDINKFLNRRIKHFSKTEREHWSQHKLYQQKSKEEMQALSQQKKKLSSQGKKYKCVKHLVEKMENASPPLPLKEYSHELSSVLESIIDISKLSVCNLHKILRFHYNLDCGTKDELVIRV